MADETIVKPEAPQTAGLEAAEIRAWRKDRVRRLPRRATVWTLRIVALCVGVLLLFVVLAPVLTVTSDTVSHTSRADGPHQK